MSSMYNPPLYVRYGLKHRVELLGYYGISITLHPLFVLRISPHPIGNPIIHSANWGLMYCPIRSGKIIPRLEHIVCPCFPMCSCGVCLRIGLKS